MTGTSPREMAGRALRPGQLFLEEKKNRESIGSGFKLVVFRRGQIPCGAVRRNVAGWLWANSYL